MGRITKMIQYSHNLDTDKIKKKDFCNEGDKSNIENGYLAKSGSNVLTSVSSLQSPEQLQECYYQIDDPRWDWAAGSFCLAPNGP